MTNEDAPPTLPTPPRQTTHKVPADEAGTLPLPEIKIGPADIPKVPGYTIESEIGRGGMGVVYKAKQDKPSRWVALKMVLSGGFASPEARMRFLLEGEVLGRLQHPNIVQIYEVGTFEGQPYFALEYVDGGSLNDLLKKKHSFTIHEAALLIEQLARAMQYAHGNGVIHRDLKPANILLSNELSSSSSSSGLSPGLRLPFVPKITDFGLAKQVDVSADLTASGAILGTPAYMAPEQARGKSREISTATDVYALGAMLYELLAGRPPFVANHPYDVIAQVMTEEPPSVSSLRGKLPKDLVTIVHKCLQKEPRKRYASAGALADDLQNWREHRPITARPATRLELVMKWCSRYPALAALIFVSTLTAIIVTGLVVSVWQMQRAVAAEKLAKQNEQLAEEERRISAAVRKFLQEKLLGQADAKARAEALLRTGLLPQEITPNPTIRELLDRAALELAPKKIDGHFPGQYRLQAELLQTVGNTYRGIGGQEDQFASAIRFLQRAVALRQQHQAVDHPDTLLAMENLAETYLTAGKLKEAIQLLEQVHAGQVKLLGADHPNTLKTLYYIAEGVRQSDKSPESIPLFVQVLTAQARHPQLGPLHVDTLTTQNSLAYAYWTTGRLPESIQQYEQVRSARTQTLGADHPDTLITLHYLAIAYRDAGRLQEAIDLLKQVRELRQEKLGAEHPDFLNTQASLAVAYRMAGELSEAIKLYSHVLAVRTKRLGELHPDTLLAMNNLAEAYFDDGQVAQAMALLEKGLELCAARIGMGHRHAITMKANLAKTYQASGRLPESVPLFEQALTGIEHLQYQHQYAKRIFHDAVAGFEKVEQFAKAQSWQRKWRAVVEARAGADSAAHAEESSLLGEILLQQARRLPEGAERKLLLTESETLLMQGYEGMKRHYTAKEPKSEAPMGAPTELSIEQKKRLFTAAGRLIDYFQLTGQPEQVKAWQVHQKEWQP